MKKLISVGALALLAIIGTAPAQANSLISTNPTASQSLEAAPSAVTITTELPIMDQGSEVVVTDPAGVRVDDGTLTIAENEAVVGLKNLIRTGIYTVTYTILAENDVPLTGTFTFNYTQPQVVASPEPTPTQTPAPTGNDAGTTIFVIGLLLAAAVVAVALVRYARKLYNER